MRLNARSAPYEQSSSLMWSSDRWYGMPPTNTLCGPSATCVDTMPSAAGRNDAGAVMPAGTADGL